MRSHLLHAVLVVVVAFAPICFAQAPTKPPRQTESNSPNDFVYGDFVIGAPVTHSRLTLFPISSKTPRNEDRFITLDEGLRAGLVTLTEVSVTDSNATPDDAAQPAADPFGAPRVERNGGGEATAPTESRDEGHERDEGESPSGERPAADPIAEDENPFGDSGRGAEVNRLLISNRSDKPLYLMPGEVISGGQQDRTIGEELVIQPGAVNQPIDAFCVERGRWENRDLAATQSLLSTVAASGGSLAPEAFAGRSRLLRHGGAVGAGADADVPGANRNDPAESATPATEAADGTPDADGEKFVASVGQLNKEARVAVQHAQEQGEVWRAVDKLNAKTGNRAESSNFSANYGTPEIAERLAPYLKKCHKPVVERRQVVGVVVAINGRVEAADLFESTPLFKKFWPKLLRSYALDAVAAEGNANDKEPNAVKAADCVLFLQEIQKAPVGEVERDEDVAQYKRESKHVVSFTLAHGANDEPLEAKAGGVGGGAFGGGGGLGGGVHTGAFAK